MRIFSNISLKPYNTFGIDVQAENFASFSSVEMLQELLSMSKGYPLLVMGGGSNLLFTKNIAGWVLKNDLKGVELVAEDTDFYYVKAWGGEVWHEFVCYCVQHNYAGIENLSLIPGTVGASPMQNIGAYGVEIKDVFHSLDALHIESQTIVSFDKEACQFGYRESVFKRQHKGAFIILNVTFKLRKKPLLHTSYGAIHAQLEQMKVVNPTVKDIAQAVINIREAKLPNPAQIGNAGSFFKNPVIEKKKLEKLQQLYPALPVYPTAIEHLGKTAAAWLIEAAGWKGFKEKNYGVHDKQALVLVNYGGATGSEIVDLSSRIIQDVKNKFDITLEREVNIIP